MINSYGPDLNWVNDAAQCFKSLRRDVLAVLHGATAESLHKAWRKRKQAANQSDVSNDALFYSWNALPAKEQQPFIDFVKAVQDTYAGLQPNSFDTVARMALPAANGTHRRTYVLSALGVFNGACDSINHPLPEDGVPEVNAYLVAAQKALYTLFVCNGVNTYDQYEALMRSSK